MNNSLKRIISDIRNLSIDPIDNIYYYPCEENIMKGYALIFGPLNTPYEHGNYIFEFNFTNEYPFQPPVVTYLSNDGMTRYNPNFYRNGKVCLSILNTWRGEPWSPCQSIRSILITLQFTMNENPLLNEPGVHEINHSKCIQKYNDIICYKNIQHTIVNYIENTKNIPVQNEEMIEIIIKNFYKNLDYFIEKTTELCKKNINHSIITLNIYNQNVKIEYEKILQFLLKKRQKTNK